MGIYGGLTARQRELRDQVCATATTLEDRLRALGQHTWRGTNGADIETVRGWLFDLHHADIRECDG